MATQLPLYDIELGHLDEFVAAWVGGVRSLRQVYAGSQGEFEARDAAYYASPDRVLLDPDPAQRIRATEHLFVEEVAALNNEMEDLA